MSAGDLLRAGRETLGLTQDQAAKRLLCQTSLVATLETGERPDMAPVYVEGFLTRYLDLLALHDEERKQVLDYFSSGVEAEVRSVFPVSRRRPGSDSWMKLSGYAIGGLLVGTVIWQMSSEWVRLNGAQLSLTAPTVSDSVIRSEPRPASRLATEGPILPGSDARATEDEDMANTLSDVPPLAGAGEFMLVLEASADSWVEISGAGGAVLEQDLLRGGEQRRYKNRGPFMISVGRASAVRVTLNDFPVDLEPHTQDDVARLWLQPEQVLPEPGLAGTATVTSTFSD